MISFDDAMSTTFAQLGHNVQKWAETGKCNKRICIMHDDTQIGVAVFNPDNLESLRIAVVYTPHGVEHVPDVDTVESLVARHMDGIPRMPDCAVGIGFNTDAKCGVGIMVNYIRYNMETCEENVTA